MNICLKGILQEGFLFDGNVKIINANLKFLIKVATQNTKFNFYKNEIYIVNLKSFSNQRSDSASKLSFPNSFLRFLTLFVYIKHLSILSMSHLIRQWCRQRLKAGELLDSQKMQWCWSCLKYLFNVAAFLLQEWLAEKQVFLQLVLREGPHIFTSIRY